MCGCGVCGCGVCWGGGAGRQKLAKQLAAAKQASVGFEAAQRKYEKLVKVHTQQGHMLQQLQEALRKAVAEGRVAKETIKTQEAVIARLEDMLEKTHLSHAGPLPLGAGLPGRNHPRNRHLRRSSDSQRARSVAQPPGSRRSPSRPGSAANSDAGVPPTRPGSGKSADIAGGDADADADSDAGPTDGDTDGGDSADGGAPGGEEEEKRPLGELDIDPMDGGGDTMTVTKKAWNKAMSQLKAKHTRMTVRCGCQRIREWPGAARVHGSPARGSMLTRRVRWSCGMWAHRRSWRSSCC